MFVFDCVVSNSLYCRVCFLFFRDQVFVDFVSFLSMIIYEVLYTLSWCLRYNICSTWFLDIRISTCCVWSSCLGPLLSVNLFHHVSLHSRGVHRTSGLCKYDHESHYRFVIGWLPISSVILHCSLVAMYM